MALSFRLASYNVLANSYVNPAWYPKVDPKVLDWSQRKFALAEKIERLDADVVCLQELEEDAYSFLELNLRSKGYNNGSYARKNHGKPDGCAIFSREGMLRFISSEAVYYDDGLGRTPSSGHLALIANFESAIGIIKIASTHLKWDSQNKAPAEHIGYRQVKGLIANCVKANLPAYAWIICGDLNAEPGSPIVQELILNGFVDAYHGAEQPTCNPNQRAKRIDYIFHTAGLKAIPAKLTEIDDFTPLPSANEPSDHLAVLAMLSS